MTASIVGIIVGSIFGFVFLCFLTIFCCVCCKAISSANHSVTHAEHHIVEYHHDDDFAVPKTAVPTTTYFAPQQVTYGGPYMGAPTEMEYQQQPGMAYPQQPGMMYQYQYQPQPAFEH